LLLSAIWGCAKLKHTAYSIHLSAPPQTYLAIKKYKSTLIVHLSSVRTAVIKNKNKQTNKHKPVNAGEDIRKRNPHTLLVGMKVSTTTVWNRGSSKN
jgi:hypothetical protein